MKFFNINSKLLGDLDPDLREKISNTRLHDDSFDIIPLASGYPTASIQGKFIHSSRNPVREAKNIITSKIKKRTSVCIMEGFGLGYYAEEALKLSSTILVIVVEPSPARFKKALKTRDFSKLFSSSRIMILLGKKAKRISPLLASLPPGDIALVRNRALYTVDTSYYSEIERDINRFIARKEVNETTLQRFGHIWIRNFINNMAVIPESRDLRILENVFSNIPVLLLVAGPSLTDLLPHLSELQKRCVIVAVDTVSKALDQIGIVPDFLVVIDPQYWNARHLDRIDLEKTILISESSTYPSVFRRNHLKLYFSGSLFPLGRFFENFTGTRKKLGAGGSVSTSAWDFCHFLTAGPVYCAGLDLGFPEKETHYKGSFFEERVHILSSRTAPAETQAFYALHSAYPFPVENNRGTTTLTDQRLIVYKQWFEEKIEQSQERTTFNLSPEGVKINGMPYTDMKVLFSFPDTRKIITKQLGLLSPSSEREKKQLTRDLLTGTQVLIEELTNLSSITKKCVEVIETYLREPDTLPYAKALTLLETYDREILTLKGNTITGFLIQPLIRDITGNELSDPFLDSKKLYSEIKKASDFHLKLLNLYVKNNKVSSK